MSIARDHPVFTVRGGVVPAMATPLAADGRSLVADAVPALVDFLLSRGVRGLFVGGTTGEGLLLDPAARRALAEAALAAVDGRAPVLVHVGANDTPTARELAGHAASVGADAIVAVTPTFYPVPDDALAEHFAAVAAAAPATPFLVYDIPHMAVNGISPALFSRLATSVPTFAGVKTSHRDAQHVRALLDRADDRVLVLAGNERVALGLLALGADGLISGLSTAVPEPFVALAEAWRRGDQAAARAGHEVINALLDLIPAGTRIGAIKRLLAERGAPVGPPVPPRAAPDQPLWPAMARRLATLGLAQPAG